jgi:hypothetical protein
MSLTHVDPHVSEIVMIWIQSGDLLMVWIQISLYKLLQQPASQPNAELTRPANHAGPTRPKLQNYPATIHPSALRLRRLPALNSTPGRVAARRQPNPRRSRRPTTLRARSAAAMQGFPGGAPDPQQLQATMLAIEQACSLIQVPFRSPHPC